MALALLRARSHPVVRHPARTRERILAAALREFSDKGFAGARVDRIARRARVNKRMLYHYFGNKESLFREILARKVRERAQWAVTAPDDTAESLVFWFDTACRDRDWVRLMEWEALGRAEGGMNGDAERRAAFRKGVAQVRERQGRGLLRADVDPGISFSPWSPSPRSPPLSRSSRSSSPGSVRPIARSPPGIPRFSAAGRRPPSRAASARSPRTRR
jgi:AcrR family transcriptional regulator